MSLFDQIARRPPLLYRSMIRQCRSVDRMDEAERRTLQDQLVQSMLKHARAVPFYRELPEWRQLSDLPILTKFNMLERGVRFERATLLPKATATTSGSSGTPLELLRSPISIVREQATFDHLISLAGGEPLTGRVAVLRGDTIKRPDDMEPPFWQVIHDRKVILSAHHLNHQTYRQFISFLESYQPTILMAYPSALQHFLNLAEVAGRVIKIPLVVTASERLPEGTRAQTDRVLGAKLLDIYGQGERVCLAWSIRDGEYWFRTEYGKVELQRKGENYKVIATGLGNTAQPLMRYDTGDQIAAAGKPSPARLAQIELGVEPFSGIFGRESEYIELPDGSRIIGLNHIPRGVKGVANVQFIQESLESIRIQIVPGAGYSEASLKAVEQNFRQKVPRFVRIEWEIADRPLRISSGKAPLYINRLRQSSEREIITNSL